jgi:hypothetical protein
MVPGDQASHHLVLSVSRAIKLIAFESFSLIRSSEAALGPTAPGEVRPAVVATAPNIQGLISHHVSPGPGPECG